MDNSKDLFKVLDGLKSAENILNTMLTPDIMDKMTPEQRKEIEDAKKGIDNTGIKKATEDLANFTNNI